MPGDYTRFTHRPERNYSSVLMQQGRVQLDADWNEQSDILQRRLRVQAMDTFGRSAVPEPTTPDAFELAPLPGPPVDLSIGGGRLYLDGLLAELHPGESCTYLGQKYYPDPPALPASGEAVAYLDVWEREVTCLEDADLLEKALGGPDTTTRLQTVWQLKWHAVEEARCGTDLDALFPPSGGRATTSALAPPASDDPCILQPSGGYRGLENRLYRVEVHVAGGLNAARFKWSRDNASIVSRVDAIAVSGTQTVLTVARIGRDKVLRFEVGDWVELTDDHRELMGEAGEMAQVAAVSEAALTVTLDRPVPGGTGRAFGATPEAVQARHTRLRKWNQRAPGNTLDTEGLILVDGSNVHLEDGVYVQLTLDPSGGEFRVGDHWVFAARTADASVEPLAGAPPRGIVHHYTQLATLEWRGTPGALHVHDCRTLWPDPHCCTVSVRPGEDIQRAVDRLPPEGGCVCLLPGVHAVETPILVDARRNILVHGLGRASKVVTAPGATGESVFYVAGASRQIRIEDFLVYSDERASLVTIAEDASEVGLAGMTLIDAAPGGDGCCVLLAGCSQVTVHGSTLVGQAGVLQADPDGVARVAAALAALRPAAGDEPADGDEAGEEPAPTPEAPPLRALAVTSNELFVTRVGVGLENALDGRVRDNVVTGLDEERLASWRRAAGKETAGAAGLHRWLEDALAGLAPVDGLDGLEGRAAGLQACLLEDFDITGNHIAASGGIRASFARRLTAGANRVLSATAAVQLGYAFDCTLRRNRISVAPVDDDLQPPEDIAETLRARVHPGRLAVATRFARGLAIEANAIDAPSAIGTSTSQSGVRCAAAYPESLLRLLRIGRLWRVVVELGWVLLVVVRALQAAGNDASPVLEEVQTRADLETLLLEWFLRLLGDPSYVPPFLGRAWITGNRLQVTRFGVFLDQLLSVGGLHIEGNRISGFTRAGILVHALFSVGLADRYAAWLHCGAQWLIGLLHLLRERLAAMLGGEEVAEPAQPAEYNAATVGVAGVSWLLYFCSRFCQGGQTPDEEEEPGSEPESPATALKDALDDLLDHLDPAWLDDLVNQSYVVAGNTLRGSGDGICTGMDGSRVLGNHVDIEPGSTVAFETLALGAALQGRFEDTDYAEPVLFRSLLDLDRDLLLLSALQGNWVEAHLDDANFRSRLLAAVQEVVAVSPPESPLNVPLVAVRDALAAATPDPDTARQQWMLVLMLIWFYLRGYGIVMQGSDMSCSGNEVRARRGCGPGVRPDGFRPQETTAEFRLTAPLRVPGVLPAVPAIGGIWQLTNLGGWMEDLLAATLVDKSQHGNRTALLIWALLAYVALSGARDRRLAVAGNGVEEALAFGIRTLQAGGQTELDVLDNLIRDAVRHGICHREFVAEQKDAVGLHVKVHRNSVVRSSRVFELPAPPANQSTGARLDDFASLVWLENGTGRTLVGRNHGDGARLDGQRCAVHVHTTLAGISDNHVEANSQFAFRVIAAVGLFTSNLTGPGNSIVPASLVQPPNVETL